MSLCLQYSSYVLLFDSIFHQSLEASFQFFEHSQLPNILQLQCIMMKRLNNQGKVNEPKLDQMLTSEKHRFPISLERLFDPRFCIDPCIKESIDILHRSESVLRPLLPFNPIVHFQHIKQLLFGLPVSISVSQCHLAPSIALSYTEKSKTGEKPAENFA